MAHIILTDCATVHYHLCNNIRMPILVLLITVGIVAVSHAFLMKSVSEYSEYGSNPTQDWRNFEASKTGSRVNFF